MCRVYISDPNHTRLGQCLNIFQNIVTWRKKKRKRTPPKNSDSERFQENMVEGLSRAETAEHEQSQIYSTSNTIECVLVALLRAKPTNTGKHSVSRGDEEGQEKSLTPPSTWSSSIVPPKKVSPDHTFVMKSYTL